MFTGIRGAWRMSASNSHWWKHPICYINSCWRSEGKVRDNVVADSLFLKHKCCISAAYNFWRFQASCEEVEWVLGFLDQSLRQVGCMSYIWSCSYLSYSLHLGHFWGRGFCGPAGKCSGPQSIPKCGRPVYQSIRLHLWCYADLDDLWFWNVPIITCECMPPLNTHHASS